MKIIISNDDSIHSQGIKSLRKILEKEDILPFFTKNDISSMCREKSLLYKCDVWLIAPEEEQSAKSHSFTMRQPLFIKKYSDREITLSGTPADCVYFALTHFTKQLRQEKEGQEKEGQEKEGQEKEGQEKEGHNIDFDWVLSGINHGSNLGSDIYYSGTVAAAREGCLRGYPSIAISLHKNSDRTFQKDDFDRAACVLKVLLFHLPKPPVGIFYNLNVPQKITMPLSIHLSPVGVRLYDSNVYMQKNHLGQEFCWLGGPPRGYEGGVHGDNCDIAVCEQGHITLSILNLFGKKCPVDIEKEIQDACAQAQTVLSRYLS
jgi:5'-nucleotidase